MDDRPYLTISTVFAAWKLGLLAIVVGSQVGPTYDTSSALLVGVGGQPLLARLTSWDAIYFTKAAQRGYLFEQEWAFGSALPRCVSGFIHLLAALGLAKQQPSAVTATATSGTASLEVLVAVLFTTACHYLSALVLYPLGRKLGLDARWALCAALLHVLSPAGLFLSAPYAESPFALLSFVGWLFLVGSCRCPGSAAPNSSGPSLSSDALTLLSGVVFGAATWFRTNGLLNGAPFAFEFLATLYHLVEDLDFSKTPAHLRRLTVLGLSGLFVAAGSVVPQVVAWRVYCASPETEALGLRPSWCGKIIPSIYDHVQYTYWNNGLFLYWTLPNIPLFLLAGPMLFIMGKSGKDLFLQASQLVQKTASNPSSRSSSSSSSSSDGGSSNTTPADEKEKQEAASPSVDASRLILVLQSMVAAQVILVVMAFTRNHVQIITRLSSGYPAWYWWVAACLRSPKTRNLGGGIVVYMVMYACIQGVLFASFLPPA